jgi:hypothetical protein
MVDLDKITLNYLNHIRNLQKNCIWLLCKSDLYGDGWCCVWKCFYTYSQNCTWINAGHATWCPCSALIMKMSFGHWSEDLKNQKWNVFCWIWGIVILRVTPVISWNPVGWIKKLGIFVVHFQLLPILEWILTTILRT